MENLQDYDCYQICGLKPNPSPANEFILCDSFYQSIEKNKQKVFTVYLRSNSIEILKKKLDRTVQKKVYTFDSKFSELRDLYGNSYGIRIFNDNSSTELFTNDSIIVNEWIETLSKFMIGWGFYQQYQPIQKIGKGKSASVFMAINRKNGSKVAIKAFFKVDLNKQKKAMDALRNEINVLRAVRSNYIMKLRAVYQTEKSFYLVLQYIQGKQLKKVIESKQLTLKQIKNILYKLTIGLEDLKNVGIVHRDIKPQNIMYDQKSKKPIIVDFGLATFSEASKYIYKHCGTPGFVAPESLIPSTKKIFPIADVFSLGILFHLLLFRKFPYKGTKYNQILSQNRAARFKFNEECYQKADPQAMQLLAKMLTFSPESRIKTEQILKDNFFKDSEIQSEFKIDLAPIFSTRFLCGYPQQSSSSRSSTKSSKDDRMKLLKSGSLEFILRSRKPFQV